MSLLSLAISVAFTLVLLRYVLDLRRKFHKIQKEIQKVFGEFSLDKLSENLENLRKKSASLEKKLSIYTSLLDEMPVGVVLVNKSGKIIFTNRTANKFLLSSPTKARETPLSPITFTLEISQAINDALSGEEKTIEIEIKQHRPRIVKAHIKPLLKEGRAGGAVVVMEDITELRKLEKLKQSLISDFSHELRTPLTSLKSSVEALVDFGALDDPNEARKFLENVRREVDNLSDLVGKMMQLARLESGAENVLVRSKFNLEEIVVQAVKAVQVQAEKKKVPIFVSLKASPLVEGDRGLLTQAIINILDNAVKYSPVGRRIFLEVNIKKGVVLVAVRDEGPGIPQEDLPRIFRRFYRGEKHRSRSTGGVGLGLSLVKHIVEAHNGRVEVESELNRGSKFTLFLPISSENLTQI